MVLDDSLERASLINASACIASGLFNNENNLLGPEIKGDYYIYISITRVPILILKQNNKTWKELLNRAKKNKLKYMLFTKEGQSTISYEEYVQRVQAKPIEKVNVIGIGVLGEDQVVQKFCGDLPLLR